MVAYLPLLILLRPTAIPSPTPTPNSGSLPSTSRPCWPRCHSTGRSEDPGPGWKRHRSWVGCVPMVPAKQDGWHFTENIFIWLSGMKTIIFCFKFQWNLFTRVHLTIIRNLTQWWSIPLTHLCATQPQWVNSNSNDAIRSHICMTCAKLWLKCSIIFQVKQHKLLQDVNWELINQVSIFHMARQLSCKPP